MIEMKQTPSLRQARHPIRIDSGRKVFGDTLIDHDEQIGTPREIISVCEYD